MKRKLVIVIAAIVLANHIAYAEDLHNIANPNFDAHVKAHGLTITPRDPQVVADEKKLLVKAAEAIAAYAQKHGIDQAADEMGKSKDGAFGEYCLGGQIRLNIFQFLSEDTILLKGHNLFLGMVGLEVSLEQFADLSGWKFLKDEREAAFSEQGKGWVTKQIFVDDFWPGDGKPHVADCYNLLLDTASRTSVSACHPVAVVE